MERDTEIKKLRSDSAELSDGVSDLLRYAVQQPATDERTILARKLRCLYWDGNPPPEDEAFASWLQMADEVRNLIQEAIRDEREQRGGVSMNDVTEKIAGFMILTVIALINLAMVWLAFRGISYLLSFVGL